MSDAGRIKYARKQQLLRRVWKFSAIGICVLAAVLSYAAFQMGY